ncbi:hypothetical protein ABIE44_000843 [Marmoricola sp. OAE513]|uniref:hypothetical protein n=1 Tax=Marmoricola sp. OAE513 TaxID=2817894 RepID=UPI001AE3E8F3
MKVRYVSALAVSVTFVLAGLAQTTTEPAAAAEATSDACGTKIVKSTGGTWECTLADNFDGTSLNRNVWMPQTDFAMGTQAAHACFVDDPAYVGVSGGSLNLTLRKVIRRSAAASGD